MPVTIDSLADKESDFESAKEGYLREHGWKHSCDNPASRWFWQKELPDG